MKILIVDDNAKTKCRDIIEQCRERNIEVEIKGAIGSACYYLCHHENPIDGVILDMGLPIYEDERQYNANGGDRVLRELRRRNINIPVLIFSNTESKEKQNCKFVFAQIYNWYIVQEEEKFFAFLEKLQKEQPL